MHPCSNSKSLDWRGLLDGEYTWYIPMFIYMRIAAREHRGLIKTFFLRNSFLTGIRNLGYNHDCYSYANFVKAWRVLLYFSNNVASWGKDFKLNTRQFGNLGHWKNKAGSSSFVRFSIECMSTENLTFTLKSHQMLSVTCTLEKLERATIPGQ